MKNQLLGKLKVLQKVRGDTNAFANHDEFLPWSDSVTPLLEFDEALHKKFIFWSDHVKSAYRMGREHQDALGECIGVMNQAVIKLELQPENETPKENEKIKEIPYPSKFTLKWLYQHAPISLWGWFVGLLLSAFALGIGFSETSLYQLLKSEASESAPQPPELNKSSKLDAVTGDPS
ncbi:MAG: hypothetical protein OQK98_08415 [Gammaproteobacteria bacterium]|nr:hypothetical protein [Gammaproteobacteria bacterium]